MTGVSLALLGTLCTALGAIIAAVITSRVSMRKVNTDADASLRGDLLDRLVKLEGRIDRMTANQAAERELHNAEMGVMRHRMNNESQAFDAALNLLEGTDAVPADRLKRILDHRDAQRSQYITEMAAITTARIDLAKLAGTEGVTA
ncbi:MAG: hypothetical protein A2885_13440 [Sphingopyxis sp. RIFCSPHIGHO2_01_FULL_65_24]|nr:MAG: hypothetical protein A2885_13440 [Sphingopyxis sp. RIFCSPHIGHO2_01_FULL_65_24]